MVRQGAANLNASREAINDLNVFPIPDGDTGDNMYMTISAGVSAAASDASLGTAASKISGGMLLGARGNSGVILSRIFAGIAKGLSGEEDADVELFAQAMSSGVREAYGAVSTPVEGTILTVLREGVEAADGIDFESYFDALVRQMRISLAHTPELLAVLKEAGVVDSGGAGLLCIAEGMLDSLNGVSTEISGGDDTQKAKVNLDDFGPDTELLYGYCTEFLLRLQTSKVDIETFDEGVIRDYLNSVGDSVVCFRDGSIVKVHVHTKTPGDILSHVQTWGEFLTVKIENMTLQHSEVHIRDNFSKPKPYGVVAVASGEGIIAAFREAGVSEVIEGGQTMNPSAQSFIEAFDRVGAETMFVLPNNSNIIMTAQQAAQMYTRSKVVVLPSKNIGAGYVAAASLDCSSCDTEAITAAALETIESVVCGFVSRAIRDANMEGVSMHKDDFVGISGGRIVCSDSLRNTTTEKLSEIISLGGSDVALVFSGADVAAAEAESLVAGLQKKYPRTEIILNDGGQPVYDYIIVLC